MTVALGLWAAAGAIVCVALWALTRHQRLKRREQAWLPQELRTARLEFAERGFYTRWPFRLYARIDRAYRPSDGALVLTEFKRRFNRQAYQSDVLELSAQRLAIERGARMSVAATGFVVVEHPGTNERTPIPVTLLQENELTALRRRYQLLLDGTATPNKRNDLRLCRSCAYVDRCQPDVVRDPGTASMNGRQTDVAHINASAETSGLSATGATSARAVRRPATGRNPGKSKTRARGSPGSGQRSRQGNLCSR